MSCFVCRSLNPNLDKILMFKSVWFQTKLILKNTLLYNFKSPIRTTEDDWIQGGDG